MAFVKKMGKRYEVLKGDNFEVLSSFPTRAQAEAEVRRLHKENNPLPSNRNKAARKRFNINERE